jgi:hypothetical protein
MIGARGQTDIRSAVRNLLRRSFTFLASAVRRWPKPMGSWWSMRPQPGHRHRCIAPRSSDATTSVPPRTPSSGRPSHECPAGWPAVVYPALDRHGRPHLLRWQSGSSTCRRVAGDHLREPTSARRSRWRSGVDRFRRNRSRRSSRRSHLRTRQDHSGRCPNRATSRSGYDAVDIVPSRRHQTLYRSRSGPQEPNHGDVQVERRIEFVTRRSLTSNCTDSPVRRREILTAQ